MIRQMKLVDRAGGAAVWTAALLVTASFVFICWGLFAHGWSGVSFQFLSDAPSNAGRGGGILPVLASTGLLLLTCLAITVPLGLGTAIFLTEVVPSSHRGGRLVRRSLELLAGAPSIVFGLFGCTLFCNLLGLGFSILSGALTLACMILPFFVKAAEEGLRAVSPELRLTAAGLGLSRQRALAFVVLPAAAYALCGGLVLAVARALAETAALIFTSGYVDRMPRSVFDSGRAVSVHIYDLAMNIPGGDKNASSTALVLLFSVCALNVAFRKLTMRMMGAK